LAAWAELEGVDSYVWFAIEHVDDSEVFEGVKCQLIFLGYHNFRVIEYAHVAIFNAINFTPPSEVHLIERASTSLPQLNIIVRMHDDGRLMQGVRVYFLLETYYFWLNLFNDVLTYRTNIKD